MQSGSLIQLASVRRQNAADTEIRQRGRRFELYCRCISCMLLHGHAPMVSCLQRAHQIMNDWPKCCGKLYFQHCPDLALMLLKGSCIFTKSCNSVNHQVRKDIAGHHCLTSSEQAIVCTCSVRIICSLAFSSPFDASNSAFCLHGELHGLTDGV